MCNTWVYLWCTTRAHRSCQWGGTPASGGCSKGWRQHVQGKAGLCRRCYRVAGRSVRCSCSCLKARRPNPPPSAALPAGYQRSKPLLTTPRQQPARHSQEAAPARETLLAATLVRDQAGAPPRARPGVAPSLPATAAAHALPAPRCKSAENRLRRMRRSYCHSVTLYTSDTREKSRGTLSVEGLRLLNPQLQRYALVQATIFH